MSKRIRLKDENGDDLVIQKGESMDLIATFTDVSATPTALTSDDLLTITCTLYAGSTVINSRSGQSVKNANQGTLSTAGVLTLSFGPLDSIIVGTLTAGQTETHIARLTWTWNDGNARTGIVEYLWEVEELASPS